MKGTTMIGLLVLAAATGISCTSGEAPPADVEMAGSFLWVDDDDVGEETESHTGDLEAVFTATGVDKWDVIFRFEFGGVVHAFVGTASGSLDEGDIEGRVHDGAEGADREFYRFEGRVSGGILTATHGELEGGGLTETGSMTLTREP